MKRLVVWMALSALALGCGDSASSSQAVELELCGGRWRPTDFVCGETYDDLGANGTSLELSDFRFYVQEVQLKNADGGCVPVHLNRRTHFSTTTSALLDFEDGCGELGDAEINDVVAGTVPEGTYDGVRFKMGVPCRAQPRQPSDCAPPLNLTSMHWNWQGGYKFLRIDSGNIRDNRQLAHAPRQHRAVTATRHAGEHHECDNPNRVEVELDGFDPANDRRCRLRRTGRRRCRWT